MGNNVFANGREVSCKAADGKSICAFPDVCFTPPENPATPPGVPIPYPNTGMATDTTSGSKKVKVSRKEVMLKNKSYFKKSTGDEAGSAAKKGVVTSTKGGKVYFNSWSMDVKFEGENVVRHLDLTTHNHASFPGDTPTWPYIDHEAVQAEDHPCHRDYEREKGACSGIDTKEKMCADTDKAKKCRDARKCMMVPYREYKSTRKTGRGDSPCCPKSSNEYSQPHHLIEDNWVKGRPEFPWYSSSRDLLSYDDKKALLELVKPGSDRWENGERTDCDAPCVCAEGDKWEKEHGWFHCQQVAHIKQFMPGGERSDEPWNYGNAKQASLHPHKWICQSKGVECNPDCIEHQLDNFYGKDNERELNCQTFSTNVNPKKGVTEEFIDEAVRGHKPLTFKPFSMLGGG